IDYICRNILAFYSSFGSNMLYYGAATSMLYGAATSMLIDILVSSLVSLMLAETMIVIFAS
ncbi:MAG: hypothetical protein QN732_03970, partial [Nitrososphaeraceae archaeon]|nr:hypothetical protein [Nitrososphaeraceae archaeon]